MHCKDWSPYERFCYLSAVHPKPRSDFVSWCKNGRSSSSIWVLSVEYLNPRKVRKRRTSHSFMSFIVGEINIPIMERDVCGTYKMMLSPRYSDLAKLVIPKGKRDNAKSSSAITKYRVIDSNYGVSLVECQPVTGRDHRETRHGDQCSSFVSRCQASDSYSSGACSRHTDPGRSQILALRQTSTTGRFSMRFRVTE